jgi:hypothetical protein
VYGNGPLWIDNAMFNSGNAVPDAPAADEGALKVSAGQQELNDAANRGLGEPTGALGASLAGSRLPDRRPARE